MAVGDIGTISDPYTFDDTKGLWISLLQIADDLHCLSYSGPDDDGWARSINITAAGVISEPASNTLEFETANILRTRSRLRSTNIACITSLHADNAHYLEAVIVNSDGTLSQHANNSALFAAANCLRAQPIHVAGDTIAIAYDKNTGQAHVSTWGVTEQGEVSASSINDVLIDVLVSGFARIAHVTGDVYIVVYQRADGYAYARSITISAEGVIGSTGQSVVAITDQLYAHPDLIRLKDNVFIAVCQGPNEDGWAVVFEVSNIGVITVPTNNLYEFDTGLCELPRALRISDEIFAVVYAYDGNIGRIKTIKCQLASAATWTAHDDSTYTDGYAAYPMITHRDGDVFCIVYSDNFDKGIIKTAPISTSPIVSGHTELIMGIGP